MTATATKAARRKGVDALEETFRRVYETIMARAIEELGPSTVAQPVAAQLVAQVIDQMAGDQLTALFARGYDEAAVGVSDAPAFFDVRDAEAARFLDSYKVRLANSISDTLNRKLTRALSEGMDLGESIPQLRDRVQTLIPETVKNGAERVARTETARAYGEGKVAGWEKGGIERKEWLLSANPCDLCHAIWTKGPVPVTQPFMALGETIAGVTNDYMEVQAPPSHPGCRCAATPVFEDAA